MQLVRERSARRTASPIAVRRRRDPQRGSCGDVPAFSIPAGRSSQSGVHTRDERTRHRQRPRSARRDSRSRRGLRARSEPGHQRPGVRALRIAPRDPRAARPEDPPFTIDDARFLEAVAYVIAGAVDRAATEEELRRRALEDPLTGLANRALLANQLEARASSCTRGIGDRVCLLALDLDRFKAVNDTLGHTVGDTLLRQVAARLSACVREEDLVARARRRRVHGPLHADGDRSRGRRPRAASRRRVAAAVRARRPRGVRHGQRRHRRQRATGTDARGAAARRRHRDVPRQGTRRRPLRGVRPVTAPAARRADGDRGRPAPRDRARAARAALPADRRSRHRARPSASRRCCAGITRSAG